MASEKDRQGWILFWTALGSIAAVVVAVATVFPSFSSVPAIVLVGAGAGVAGAGAGAVLGILLIRPAAREAEEGSTARPLRIWLAVAATLLAGVVVLGVGAYRAGTAGASGAANGTTPVAHTSGSSTPASPPGPTPTSGGQTGLELPSGYVGTWLGTITVAPSGSNPASFKVEFTGGKLSERVGTATMGPSGACNSPSSADVTLQGVESDSITVTFVNETTNCLAPIGTITVRLGTNQLTWDLILTYGEWRGQLSKTS